MRWSILGVVICLAGLPTPLIASEADEAAFAAAKALGRSINLGNALEAPKEGEWGVTLQAEYFAEIKKAGFDSVRLPVRWSAHAEQQPPYRIDEAFFKRVDWAIDQALKNKLVIVVNVHHYDEVFQEPDEHLPRLNGLWAQIARRYLDRPETVYFELLNEPHAKLTDERWNAELPKLLATVRATNPTRPVIIGPGQWSNVHNLVNMKLPAADRHIIGTFHYYLPFQFTHQGAHWAEGADAWKGRVWPRSPEEAKQMEQDFAVAAAWSEREQRPLFLGEFGVYSAAEMEQRVKWTAAVRQLAEKHQLPWAYWEFCSGFGAYDPEKNAWREPLITALMGERAD